MAEANVTQTQSQDQGRAFDLNTLLYFLSGAGRGFGGQGGVGDIIGGMTQQHIRARSQMDFIKQLLSGGGKVNLDRDNVSIKAPVSAFGGEGLGFDQKTVDAEGAMTMAPTPAPTPTPQPASFLNPSQTLPGIDDVSLAGLTSEDISQAFQLKLGAEEIERKKLSDLMTFAGAAPRDTRTALQKNYEFAKTQGFVGGLVEFQNASETAHKKNYDEAVKGGYTGTFHEYVSEITRLSGISIGEFKERKKITEEVKRASYYMSAKFRADGTKDIWNTKRVAIENVELDEQDDLREGFEFDEMERRVLARYPDAKTFRDPKTDIVGWSIDGVNFIAVFGRMK